MADLGLASRLPLLPLNILKILGIFTKFWIWNLPFLVWTIILSPQNPPHSGMLICRLDNHTTTISSWQASWIWTHVCMKYKESGVWTHSEFDRLYFLSLINTNSHSRYSIHNYPFCKSFWPQQNSEHSVNRTETMTSHPIMHDSGYWDVIIGRKFPWLPSHYLPRSDNFIKWRIYGSDTLKRYTSFLRGVGKLQWLEKTMMNVHACVCVLPMRSVSLTASPTLLIQHFY